MTILHKIITSKFLVQFRKKVHCPITSHIKQKKNMNIIDMAVTKSVLNSVVQRKQTNNRIPLFPHPHEDAYFR